MKKILVMLFAACITLSLTGCGESPTGPTITEPTPITTYRITYEVTNTAEDNVVTYVDGQGKCNQIHVGHTWTNSFTTYRGNNGSFYVYLASASVSTEIPIQTCVIKIYVDGYLIKVSTWEEKYTLAWAQCQWTEVRMGEVFPHTDKVVNSNVE